MTSTTPGSFRGRPGVRLTLLMTIHDRTHHRSLESEIVKRARKGGMRGVTVFEGHAGFSSSGSVHRTHLVSDDAPLALVLVDAPERIDAFVESIADLLDGIVALREDVEILQA